MNAPTLTFLIIALLPVFGSRGQATPTPTPAPIYSVTLAWTASTGTVTGYNIYEIVSGSYGKVATVTSPTVQATLNNVPTGSHSYVATAYNTSGESSYSNTAVAVIQAPITPGTPTNLSLTISHN